MSTDNVANRTRPFGVPNEALSPKDVLCLLPQLFSIKNRILITITDTNQPL